MQGHSWNILPRQRDFACSPRNLQHPPHVSVGSNDLTACWFIEFTFLLKTDRKIQSVLAFMEEGKMKTKNPLYYSSFTVDLTTVITTEITPVYSLFPICSLLPDGLTSQLLSDPEGSLSEKLFPRTCLEGQPLASCQSSWQPADWRGRGLPDSLQTCVKYAESESPPCQHSSEGVPITRKYRAELRGIRVWVGMRVSARTNVGL